MSLNLTLKRIKLGYKGIKENGFRDFRAIGLYYVNYFETNNETFNTSGWAYSFSQTVEKPIIEILHKNTVVYSKALDLKESFEASSYLHTQKIVKAGFYIYLKYKSHRNLQSRIRFITKKGEYFLYLGELRANEKTSRNIEVFDPWEFEQLGRIELGFSQFNPTRNYIIDFDLFADQTIDIIIPIYNGYEFLPDLFTTIDKTNLQHNVIIVNDASSDSRVDEIINDYVEHNNHAILINNETNLGFLESANKGLRCSINHAVIVNTDVELPDKWLERIVEPILKDNSIASATPFTNSGTICSFPIFLEDNTIPENMTVDEVDSFFKEMLPIYTEIPTGVGFCMAMSRKAIDEIGFFDYEAFGRGYGEENDWCQKAIVHGYKNVMVENLFVYHKHGGSFKSEEKIALCKEHQNILKQRYPNYFTDVALYCTKNPLLQFRNYVHACIRSSKINKPILVLNHLLGGGATDYLTKKLDMLANQGGSYALFSYSPNECLYHIQIFKRKLIFQFESSSLKAALSVFKDPSELWINELATYPYLPEVLKDISNYISDMNLNAKFFLHDYLCLCPSINLLNENEHYCGLPDIPMECERCYEAQKFNEVGCGESIKDYRNNWHNLLERCEAIKCFSSSSETLFHRVFPKIKTDLSPHKIKSLPFIDTNKYHHNGLNIGFLGNITKHKGAEIIRDLAESSSDDSIKFVVIGSIDNKYRVDNLNVVGDYTLENLPNIIEDEEIDIFFIPSICPETFSFTSSEVISTGLPVAVFDIGAPAERVSNYCKGLVISLNTDANTILSLLTLHADKWKKNNERQ